MSTQSTGPMRFEADIDLLTGEPYTPDGYEHPEARLFTRHITSECDQFHQDADDANCTNGSCECWCHS